MSANKLIILEQEHSTNCVLFYGFVTDTDALRWIEENIGDVEVYKVTDSRAYSYSFGGKTYYKLDGTTTRKDHVKVTVAVYREKSSAPAA